MTGPVRTVVPMFEESKPAGGEHASWDAYWAERQSRRTDTICGVTVRVPTGITLAYREELRRQLDADGESSYAAIATALLRAPNGSEIPDLWDRWQAGGMEVEELEVVVAWAMAHASGNPISYAEADQHVRQSRAGKAPQAAVKKNSSASTGGPSRPASRRRTASTPTG